jgi:spore coat protein U-like protein
MKNWIRALTVAALALTATGAAQAQTATTTFNVTANVQEACTVGATNLAFGNYLATAAAPLDQTSTITVTCTNGTSYDVDVGLTPMARTMAGPGGATLNYGMFNEVGRTTAFGVTGAAGSGAAQAYTVFGRIPVAQFVTSGAYSATVTVTVTY